MYIHYYIKAYKSTTLYIYIHFVFSSFLSPLLSFFVRRVCNFHWILGLWQEHDVFFLLCVMFLCSTSPFIVAEFFLCRQIVIVLVWWCRIFLVSCFCWASFHCFLTISYGTATFSSMLSSAYFSFSLFHRFLYSICRFLCNNPCCKTLSLEII